MANLEEATASRSKWCVDLMVGAGEIRTRDHLHPMQVATRLAATPRRLESITERLVPFPALETRPGRWIQPQELDDVLEFLLEGGDG